MRTLLSACLPLVLALALAGCLSDRISHADLVAGASGFTRAQVQTDHFLLTAYSRVADSAKPYDVYIEGDGLAWVSPTEPSLNPTPRKALALSLAALDPAPNVIYIARPCQFTPFEQDPNCRETYWTDRRFSEDVIASVNQAIDKLTGLSAKTGRKINLIGYSGGGAVAVLVAARRDDVVSIRTVAGNLDHVEVNRLHDVSQMPNSLNAIDVAPHVAGIPQIHFLGLDDDVIPQSIGERYLAASQPTNCVKLHLVAGATHEDGWLERWPDLLKEIPACE